MRQPTLNRRSFLLKSAGVSLSLPFFDSLLAKGTTATPIRMAAIGNLLGFYLPEFFPKTPGANYEVTRLLKPLEPHRNDFTLFSGLDHDVKGGHFAVHSFLSGVLTADAKGRPDGNISIDQLAAESVGSATRFPSLTIGSQDGIHGGCQMCWTRSGTRVPPISGPRELFRKLFINESTDDLAASRDRFTLKGSILDAVQADAKSLERKLNKDDRNKLDEYFTSVREVEQRLELSKHWAEVPKPKPPIDEPTDTNMVDDLPLLYDLMALALETDSTRIATLEIGGDFEARYFDIKSGYHALSHHGKVQANIDSLLILEDYQMKHFARFLTKLKSITDGDGTLLDHTMVLFGSGMANANAHTNKNLPIILAGGGFKHGEYKAIPTTGLNRRPLSNLFVSMLQQFGFEAESFSNSTGALL
jgi:hypothetical protein